VFDLSLLAVAIAAVAAIMWVTVRFERNKRRQSRRDYRRVAG
jgi:hypothetical protein